MTTVHPLPGRDQAEAWGRRAGARTCLALVETDVPETLGELAQRVGAVAQWNDGVLLVTLTLDDAEIALEALRRDASETERISATIGFTAPRAGEAWETLRTRLEAALGRARLRGGNRVEGILAASDGSLTMIGLTGRYCTARLAA